MDEEEEKVKKTSNAELLLREVRDLRAFWNKVAFSDGYFAELSKLFSWKGEKIMTLYML